MFRCEQCGGVVAPGIRTTRIVVETRDKTYEPRGSRERDRVRRFGRKMDASRKARRRQVFDKGGRGTEIVREIVACPKCALEVTAARAEAAAQAEAAATATAAV